LVRCIFHSLLGRRDLHYSADKPKIRKGVTPRKYKNSDVPGLIVACNLVDPIVSKQLKMSKSSIKPIIFHSHAGTPNPRKVEIILKELGLPYTVNLVDIAKVKEASYTGVNPNGRLPAIEDPNTGVKLWESGAIVQYLIETYDKEETLTYTTIPEKYELNQWLMFQMSGQGPYYGQAVWFTNYHPEKLPSAIER